MFNQTELAWAAGFFDGEGCTSCNKNTNQNGVYRHVRMSISQTDIRPLLRFQKAVLGLGHIRVETRPLKPNHKRQWRWFSNKHEHVQAIIALLWKFLSEPKREQAYSKLIEHNCRKLKHAQTGHHVRSREDKLRRKLEWQRLWRAKKRIVA